MTEVIMIKYAELTTKKDNRKFFIKELVTNIRRKIDNIEIEYSLDRMYIRSSDLDDVVTKLKEIYLSEEFISMVDRIVKEEHLNLLN